MPNSFGQKKLRVFSIELKLPNSLFCQIFLADFASQGVLNQDPTVWLDGARPANTFIPPSVLGNMPTQLSSVPTPKSTFASIKN